MKYLKYILLVTLLFPRFAYASVTPGNVSSGSSGSSPLTFSHTVSATSTNPYMLVGFRGFATDSVSSVTYSGASMTLISKLQNNNGTGRWSYLYGYVPTSTGAGNVVITDAGTDNIDGVALSYGGVASLGNVSSTNPGGNLTALSVTVTSTIDASRLSAWFYDDGANLVQGTATLLRSNGANNGDGMFDSSVDLGVAGAYALGATGSSGHWTALEVVLNPVAATVPSSALTPINNDGGVVIGGFMGI